MVFWKAFEISKIKNINPFIDTFEMMIHRDIMSETGLYETVKSNPSIMDDPYAHFIE